MESPWSVTSSITVAVRKRPLSSPSITEERDIITCDDSHSISVHETKTRFDLKAVVDTSVFSFDYVFNESLRNYDVYKTCCQPMLSDVRNGGSAVVVAFGQTGSGKTHTMLGHGNKTVGLCGYAIRELAGGEPACKLAISFYEVYGSKLFDLLNGRAPLRVLQDEFKNLHIVGLAERVVTHCKDAQKLIYKGELLRSSGSTHSNNLSSRSHAVLEIKLLNSHEKPHSGRITLIDLAGSERVADTTGSDAKTRHEAAEINKSLLALKECIRAVSLNKRHIPFRASKLTQVLRESFVGNCRTCFIATISPSQRHCEDTLNTLRYASRIKDLRTPSDDASHRKAPMVCPNCNGPVRPGSSHTCARLSARCPHCRQAVERHSLEEHIEECSEFPVRCPRCNELLVRGELPRHNRRCSRSLVRCPLCTCHVMRCSLEKHTLMDCGAKLEKCRYCGQGFPRHSLKRHEAGCTMMKIACPYCLQYFKKVCVDAHASVCVRNPNCRLVSPSRVKELGEDERGTTNGRDWRQSGRVISGQLVRGPGTVARTKSSLQLRETRKPLELLDGNVSLPLLRVCALDPVPTKESTVVGKYRGESPKSRTSNCDRDVDERVGSTAGTSGEGVDCPPVVSDNGVCPYAAYGCLYTGCSSSIEGHVENSMDVHLHLVRSYAERVVAENQVLRERANESTGKVSDTCRVADV